MKTIKALIDLIERFVFLFVGMIGYMIIGVVAFRFVFYPDDLDYNGLAIGMLFILWSEVGSIKKSSQQK